MSVSNQRAKMINYSCWVMIVSVMLTSVSSSSSSRPCPSPPLSPEDAGCCSSSCLSWDDCLECSYDNYFLCMDQVSSTSAQPGSCNLIWETIGGNLKTFEEFIKIFDWKSWGTHLKIACCWYDRLTNFSFQIGDAVFCTRIQDREKDICYENCY